MKKIINMFVLFIISLFTFVLSTSALELKDNEWHSVTSDGNVKACGTSNSSLDTRVVDGNCEIRLMDGFEPLKDNDVKVNVSYGSYTSEYTVTLKAKESSKEGNERKEPEKKEWPKIEGDGQWHAITSSGTVKSCSSSANYIMTRVANGNCEIKTIDGLEMLKENNITIHVNDGGTDFEYMRTITPASNDTNNKTSKSGSDTDVGVFQICNPDENPEVVVGFRIAGIFITIIKIIVPIVLIVMGMIDLSKAVAEGKDDSLKKSLISFLNRVIAGILIFFVPSIMLALYEFVDGWDNVRGKYEVCLQCLLGDSQCPDVKMPDEYRNPGK